jgi:translocation and assembly module TamA
LIDGRLLTPGLLDELQSWSLGQIKNEGYACPGGRAQSDPTTGETVTDLEPGESLRIKEVRTTGDVGISEGTLDRYNAFLVGDIYRDYLVTLTRNRTLEDGFLQTIVLTPKCEPDGVTLLRDVATGPSRSVRIGFGASTEEGGRLRILLRQSRIGESASSAQARVNVSYLNETVNQQIADASYRWFYSDGENRSFIEPSVTFEHLAESVFETRTTEAKIHHGWNRELSRGQIQLKVGPTWSQSVRARGPPVASG